MPSNITEFEISKEDNKFNNFILINKISFDSNFPERSITEYNWFDWARSGQKENRIKYSYPFSRFHQHSVISTGLQKRKKKKKKQTTNYSWNFIVEKKL